MVDGMMVWSRTRCSRPALSSVFGHLPAHGARVGGDHAVAGSVLRGGEASPSRQQPTGGLIEFGVTARRGDRAVGHAAVRSDIELEPRHALRTLTQRARR